MNDWYHFYSSVTGYFSLTHESLPRDPGEEAKDDQQHGIGDTAVLEFFTDPVGAAIHDQQAQGDEGNKCRADDGVEFLDFLEAYDQSEHRDDADRKQVAAIRQ